MTYGHTSYSSHFSSELNRSGAKPVVTSGCYHDVFVGQPHLWPDAVWQTDREQNNLLLAPESLDDSFIKERLKARWADTHGGYRLFVSPRQRALFSILVTYADVFYPRVPYPTLQYVLEETIDVCLLHILNHCIRASDNTKRNKRMAENISNEIPTKRFSHDRGFTRARVLILAPMRNRAWALANRLVQLSIKEKRTDSVHEKRNFFEAFGIEEGKKEAKIQTQINEEEKYLEPSDHQAIFAGNRDDMFCLGFKITKGVVNLYTELSDSDVILCSPSAIVAKIEAQRKKGCGLLDFLSSVEIVLVDRSDVIAMQNWAHLITCLNAVNRLPERKGCEDIMCVYDWCLSGKSQQYRQTIILSSFPSAEMCTLFSLHCVNHSGRWRLRLKPRCISTNIATTVPQFFEYVHVTSISSEPDEKYHYFVNKIWSQLKHCSQGQLILVSSYFDFVRIRHFLNEQHANFVSIDEHSSHSEVMRSKSFFFDGRSSILLYTERAHFYHRYKIRGIKNLLCYSPPDHVEYYAELLKELENKTTLDKKGMIIVIFTKFDSLQLERILGYSEAKRMLRNCAVKDNDNSE